jgi:hypothetical protein
LRGALRARGIEGLIAGKTKRSKDGRMVVTYDFARGGERDDFHLMRSAASKLDIEGGELELRGECRWLDGDPFEDDIEITLGVSSYDELAPNVNIALWTHAGDEVTYVAASASAGTSTGTGTGRGESATSAGPRQTAAAAKDYVVFGAGYEPPGAILREAAGMQSTTSRVYQIRVLESQRVAFPCFVILGGLHGERLHRTYTVEPFECAWAEAVNRRMRGAQVMRLRLSTRIFEWTVNRLSLHDAAIREGPTLRSLLERDRAEGSFTLFTNGRGVRLASLRVEGRLREAWASEEVERRSEAAWGRWQARVKARRGAAPAAPPKASTDGDGGR